ncbi:RNA polymerase II transcription factor [Trichosporon asahii var. asahii CBS 8904]|uniref:RNA polymerase II transcription factor n=1 Tax=Trichosporon asahii var. asahii (strain CBS 8904) TaxID=1220162 RepID=K1VEP0_TRIAC|nr:RNA polymerase II transcription factor [Trichosporon asahii var. asahii CBS 8904]
MSYPPAEDRAYQGYYGRPSSAHGTQQPPDAPSPQRLHSAGSGATYPRNAPPHSPYTPHEVAPPGSSHGLPPPVTPVNPSSAPYPQQQQTYPAMPPNQSNQENTSPNNSRPGTADYTPDGAPIVPVGISGGKMFRCRGFGECNKVFTRSEHLARHVRKHTGERPFPCHCGKAFSRLDNLRQHAATVHADQTQLNEAMLAQLAQVHATLSQRANREQRRRGEVVEVPKNAVERPRGERGPKGGPPNAAAIPPGGHAYPGNGAPGYNQPPHQWGPPPADHGRPRTSGSWVEYPGYVAAPGSVGSDQHPPGTAGSVGYGDDAGPSRRPMSATTEHAYPAYYEQGPPGSAHGRPATAAPPGTSGSDDSAQVVPPYRPLSSSGAAGGHYAESEPPSSAHGPPPHSPMYPPNGAVPGSQAAYPSADPNLYPQGTVPPEGSHPYPPGHDQGGYGPPPPGSSGSYYYPGQQGGHYYGQQSPAAQAQATFSSVPPGTTPTQPYPPGYNGQAGDSPFQYKAPGPSPPTYRSPRGQLVSVPAIAGPRVLAPIRSVGVVLSSVSWLGSLV